MGELTFNEITGRFIDRDKKPLSVFRASGGSFAAFVYTCVLNLDKDGAATAYGLDNPANGKHLQPLEYYTRGKHLTTYQRQRIGLGNACGDPGDGSKGHKNFNAHSRNFYWAGIKALSREEARAQKKLIDDRPDVEAGRKERGAALKSAGEGYFPVINPDTGYYISTTGLAADGSASAYDSKHYLDSSVVPYAVLAGAWNHVNVGGKILRLGDFGLAIENSTGAKLGFVYGDTGTPNKVGECSQKIHDTLGHGKGLVTFIAFPGSGSGRMITSKGKKKKKKETYQADALGANPERLIEQKARLHMANLGTNAAQLAEQVSMGGPHSDHVYQNLMLALSTFTATA
jgi:hypothetical protein